jgi:SAM-dependent methyltransferase
MSLAGKLWARLRATQGPVRRLRFYADRQPTVGDFSRRCSYETGLDKEQLSRRAVLDRTSPSGGKMRFLDVGGRDGKLSYLLGNTAPLQFDPDTYAANRRKFDSLYDYFGVDLRPAGSNVLVGDLCDSAFVPQHGEFAGVFDVIYSNNVFEHLRKPWIAAGNILQLMKTGGICITIVPFAQRYHEDPGDYFRYTPAGIVSLFEDLGPVQALEAGFDIRARRYNWQGGGDVNDTVPVDRYGAWRETWYTLVILKKL